MKRSGERWQVVPGATLCVALLAGCASQGPLRPPSLNLPAAVKHLTAARVGDGVDLSWTNPAKTSDGVGLTARHGAGALTAEICRSENTLPPDCTPFTRLPVVSGAPSTFHDALPAVMASGSVRGLYYRVRVVNAKGKGAKWTEVTTAAGAAPEALSGLQAYPVANGILLRWKANDSGGAMLRVSRGADTGRSTLLKALPFSEVGINGKGLPAREWVGTVDSGGRAGTEQRYIAYRESVAQLGGESIILRSSAVSVVVPATAKLPLPAPPTSLEAVVNTLGQAEVDLVWQPPEDASVTGYRVYRTQDGGAAVPLTPEALPGFTYADKAVQAGHRYGYTVVAVNSTGESTGAATSAVLP